MNDKNHHIDMYNQTYRQHRDYLKNVVRVDKLERF